jgi:transcription elongation factor Elf1
LYLTIIATSLFPLLGLYLYFKVENAKKSKHGINLKNRVNCPTCNKKMPIIRLPKNEYQKRYGGWTCKRCDTMMDKWGKKVDEFGEPLP